MQRKYHLKFVIFVILVILISIYLWINPTRQRLSGLVNRNFTERQPQIYNVPQNIYFLETSGRPTLDNRQLASVESTARFVHHQRITVLIFTKQTIHYNAAMMILMSTYGVRFEQTEMSSIFIGSPLEEWFNSRVWNNSVYKTEHTSDALRIALLWKHGGIYLDLDIIMIKETSFVEPSVVWEPGNISMANYFMAFNPQHNFLKLYMAKFTKLYDPTLYNDNGPRLFTKVYLVYLRILKKSRRTSDIVELKSDVMGINYQYMQIMFYLEISKETILSRETNNTVGIHMFNQGTRFVKIKPDTNCAYIHYVRKSSPNVYAAMLKSGLD